MSKNTQKLIAYDEFIDTIAMPLFPWMNREEVVKEVETSDAYTNVYATPDGDRWTTEETYYLRQRAKKLQEKRLVKSLSDAIEEATGNDALLAGVSLGDLKLFKSYMLTNGLDWEQIAESIALESLSAING